VDRVKWFRDRSLRDRAREECEILEEEFKRTICTYTFLQSVWIGQATKEIHPGSQAYAYKQAAMLERLAQDCMEYQANALKKAEVYDKWYVYSFDYCLEHLTMSFYRFKEYILVLC
jgi:hypothetical protein